MYACVRVIAPYQGSRGLNQGSRGLMDRALDLKPEVTQGCGFECRQEVSTTEVRPLEQGTDTPNCFPGAAQSATHCSNLDGLNAENIFHSSLYSV